MDIKISIESDKKGYYDRECPNEKCGFVFKINMDDWVNKVSEDEVHCPMCGIVANAESWYTQMQIEKIQETALGYVASIVEDTFDKEFRELERSSRNNKYFKVRYSPN